MKILIAGGTGFIGKALVAHFSSLSYEVIVLTRSHLNKPIHFENHVVFCHWDGSTVGDWVSYLEGVDVVLNFSGASISRLFWTKRVKRLILDSRLRSTQALVDGISLIKKKPVLLIQASGIGYFPFSYSEQDVYHEDSSKGEGFLSDVCDQCEAIALQSSIPVVILRLGVVLGWEGGFLASLLPFFRLNMGAVFGTGKQVMSWVSLDDVVGVVSFLVKGSSYRGVLNVVSPKPVFHRVFMQALRLFLGKRLFFRIPVFLFCLIFGEASSLFIKGHLVSCQKLISLGYVFKHATLQDFLNSKKNH